MRAGWLLALYIGKLVSWKGFDSKVAIIVTSRESSPIRCAFRSVIFETLATGYIIYSAYALVHVTSGIQANRRNPPQQYLVF